MREKKNKSLKGIILLIIILIIFSPSYRLAEAARENQCVDCHKKLPDDLDNLAESFEEWERSIHATIPVYCDKCHGGDPNSPLKPEIGQLGFKGVPTKEQVPALCNQCHANPRYMGEYDIRIDLENQYGNSKHGRKLLEEGNLEVPSCIDCHGKHEIRIIDDPKSPANHFNIAKTCAQCHSNKELMKKYGLRSDQFFQYKRSYHGQILYGKFEGKNPRLAPSCPGCHGIHSGKPSSLLKVSEACYNCHLVTKRYFQKSIHNLASKKQVPQCVDCHGTHLISHTNEDAFLNSQVPFCQSCHPGNSKEYLVADSIQSLLSEAKIAIEKSQYNIKQLKKDLEVTVPSLELKMADINHFLKEASSASHSQDFDIINEIVQKIHKYDKIVNQQITARYQEVRKRKVWLLKILVVLSLLFSFIAYQRTKLKKE